jgi:hypothetical protein
MTYNENLKNLLERKELFEIKVNTKILLKTKARPVKDYLEQIGFVMNNGVMARGYICVSIKEDSVDVWTNNPSDFNFDISDCVVDSVVNSIIK